MTKTVQIVYSFGDIFPQPDRASVITGYNGPGGFNKWQVFLVGFYSRKVGSHLFFEGGGERESGWCTFSAWIVLYSCQWLL